MSRKRKSKPAEAIEAAPDEEILAEGSGPVASPGDAEADAQRAESDEISADITALAAAAEAVAEAEESPSRGRKRKKSRGAVAPETETDPAVEAAAGADSEASTGTEAAADVEAVAETETETAAEANAAAETEVVAGADVDAAAELDAGADADADAAAELEAIASGETPEETDLEAGEAAALPTSAASMDAVQIKQLVEALIFASDKPITVQRLRQLTRVSDMPRLEATLAEIARDYEDRGLVLQQVSGGYQFRTRPQFSAWVQQLIQGRPVRLSRAQLETLAIVAYRQPITRPEIDDIRGVDSSATLKLLMDRQLIRSLGKKEEVGRPTLFGTTKEFLDFFSLGDLRELPTLREYSELTDESRQVMTARLGITPDGSGSSGSSGSGGSGGSDGSGGDGGPSGGSDDSGGSDGSGGAGGDPFGGGTSGGGLDDAAMSAANDADADIVAAAIDDLDATASDGLDATAIDALDATASDDLDATASDDFAAATSDDLDATTTDDLAATEPHTDDVDATPGEMFAAGSASHLSVDDVISEGLVATDDQLVEEAADLDAAAFDGDVGDGADHTSDPAAE